MTCYVYHICREADKYDFSKGYIGISSNLEYRWYRHRNCNENPHLTNAYAKYEDIIEYVLIAGSRDYCLNLESKLRPENRIGWNLTKGGGLPPNHSGKEMSQDQKDKIGKANSGTNCANWKGWWIVENIRYETLKEVAARYNCTTKTVYNRAHSSKFPDWEFEPKGRRRG